MKSICCFLRVFRFYVPLMVQLYEPCCAVRAQVAENNHQIGVRERDTLPAMNKNLENGKAEAVPTIFGEKFCDVNVKDRVVQIIIQLENKQYDFDIFTSIFKDIGLLGASNKDIAAWVYDKESSTIHFITKKGIVSLILDLNEIKKVKKGDSVKNNSFNAIFPKKGGEIFTNKGNYYISEDCKEIVTANDELLLILKPNYKNCFKGEKLKLCLDLRCIKQKIRKYIGGETDKVPLF